MDSSAEAIAIVINGTEHLVETNRITYERLISLAHGKVPTGPNVCVSITYRAGAGGSHGTVPEGDTVEVVPGMQLHVRLTNKS